MGAKGCLAILSFICQGEGKVQSPLRSKWSRVYIELFKVTRYLSEGASRFNLEILAQSGRSQWEKVKIEFPSWHWSRRKCWCFSPPTMLFILDILTPLFGYEGKNCSLLSQKRIRSCEKSPLPSRMEKQILASFGFKGTVAWDGFLA